MSAALRCACAAVASAVVATACASPAPPRVATPQGAPPCSVGAPLSTSDAWLRVAGTAALLARESCEASSPYYTTLPFRGAWDEATVAAAGCADRERSELLWALTDHALENAYDAAEGRGSWIARRDLALPAAASMPPALAEAWRGASAFRPPACTRVEPGPVERALLELRAPMEKPLLEAIKLHRLSCGPDLPSAREPASVCVSNHGWLARQNARGMAEYLGTVYGDRVDREILVRMAANGEAAKSELADADGWLELDPPPGLPRLTIERRNDGVMWWIFRPQEPGGSAFMAVRLQLDREKNEDACAGLAEVPALFGFAASASGLARASEVGYGDGCVLRGSLADATGRTQQLGLVQIRCSQPTLRAFVAFPGDESDKYMASALIAISSARWTPWIVANGGGDHKRLLATPPNDDKQRWLIGLMAGRELRRIYARLAHEHWQQRHGGQPGTRDLSTLSLARTPQSPDCHASAWPAGSPWDALGFRPDFDMPFAFELGPARSFGLDDPDTAMLIRAHGDQDCDGVTSLHEVPVAFAHDALIARPGGFYIERERE